MAKYEIEPQCAPPGTDDYCLCNEDAATRFIVKRQRDDGIWETDGWFDNRVLAEAFVTAAQRGTRFVWGPDDVEHH